MAIARANGGSFRQCEKRVSRPLRDVNGTKGVDSQKAVPVTHKCTLADLFSFQSVTAIFPASPRPHGESGGGRERPPLFAARCGRGGVARFTSAQHPLGGSLPSQLSLQEGPEEDRGPGGPAPPNPPDAKRHIPTENPFQRAPRPWVRASPPCGKSGISHRVRRFSDPQSAPPRTKVGSRLEAVRDRARDPFLWDATNRSA